MGLTVKLIKATNLKDADFLGKTDPYVKIELEQDNVVSTEQNSTVQCSAVQQTNKQTNKWISYLWNGTECLVDMPRVNRIRTKHRRKKKDGRMDLSRETKLRMNYSSLSN